MSGPLDGIKVVDFGWYYAGSMAGVLLADQGATVVKVVRPGEAELPYRQYKLLNRNKKLLELDLKTEEGKAKALSLIEKADVLIENFRPGVMKHLGLDYAAVKRLNPGTIYLSLPGFASTDRERASVQAWEGVVSAATGAYSEIHLFRERLSFPPVYSPVPILSAYASINGAIAVMAALLARDKHGYGTRLEVPLSDVSKICVGLRETDYADMDMPEAAKELIYSDIDDDQTVLNKLQAASDHFWAYDPAENFYTCSDGRLIYMALWGIPHHARGLIKALGIGKTLHAEGFTNISPWDASLDNNLCAPMTAERRARFQEIIASVLKTRPAAEWEEVLAHAGVMATMVRHRSEWMAMDVMKQTGIHVEIRDEEATLTVPGKVGSVSTPQGPLIGQFRSPEHVIYQQALEAFDRPGLCPQQAGDKPKQSKADMLCGLKVLDFSNAAAGPVAGWWLAQYGAYVVKVDPSALSLPPSWLEALPMLSQGKSSFLADFASAPGQELFARLVKWADVVNHNIVDDSAVRMGISHAQLQAINPDIISGQITTFGGAVRGGWENRLGFDFSAQTVSGLMVDYGSAEQPQMHGAAKMADIVAGFALAFTTLVGVWQKRRTGFAGEGRTSLVLANDFAQFPLVIAENGSCHWGERWGQTAVGESWFHRLYRCSDGWVFVGAKQEDAAKLFELVTNSASDNLENEPELEIPFAEESCAYWQERLNAAGIGCQKVNNAYELYAKAAQRSVGNEQVNEVANGALEVLCWDQHPSGRPFKQNAPTWMRVGEDQTYSLEKTAPRPGGNTREMLQNLGYGAAEIEELIRLKVAHDYLPKLGNKDAYFFNGK